MDLYSKLKQLREEVKKDKVLLNSVEEYKSIKERLIKKIVPKYFYYKDRSLFVSKEMKELDKTYQELRTDDYNKVMLYTVRGKDVSKIISSIEHDLEANKEIETIEFQKKIRTIYKDIIMNKDFPLPESDKDIEYTRYKKDRSMFSNLLSKIRK